MKEKLSFDSQDNKIKFVSDFIDICLQSSPQFMNSNGGNKEVLSNKIVAVIKRPSWKESVCNKTEILMPLPLKSHLHAAVEGKAVGPMVLQRFVKSKGRHPCVYRVQWRVSNSGRTVSAWNISRRHKFESYEDLKNGDHISGGRSELSFARADHDVFGMAGEDGAEEVDEINK